MDGQELMKPNNAMALPQEKDLQALKDWGKLLQDVGILPSGVNGIQAVAIMQAGREIGLPPMQAIQKISIFRGRICVETSVLLALARKGGLEIVEKKEEAVDIKNLKGSCTITAKRGNEKMSATFTIAQAKRAGLLEGKATWLSYPEQMLYWRAAAIICRQLASDSFLGFHSLEEMHDEEIAATAVLDEVTPNAPAPAPEPAPAKKEPKMKKAEAKVKDTTSAPAPVPEPVKGESVLQDCHIGNPQEIKEASMPKKCVVGSGDKILEEIKDDLDFSAVGKEQKITLLRGFLKSIIIDKKYKNSPEQLEGKLAVKFGGHKFDDLTDELLVNLYQQDIFPKL